jgi:hypothetical protein
MLKRTTRRRAWQSLTRTNKTRKVAVGTVKKSMETSTFIWFSGSARQLCEAAAESRPVPADDGLWADEVESLSSSLPESRRQHPEHAVGTLEARSLLGALVDGEADPGNPQLRQGLKEIEAPVR